MLFFMMISWTLLHWGKLSQWGIEELVWGQVTNMVANLHHAAMRSSKLWLCAPFANPQDCVDQLHAAHCLYKVFINNKISRLPVTVQLVLHQFWGHSTVSGYKFTKFSNISGSQAGDGCPTLSSSSRSYLLFLILLNHLTTCLQERPTAALHKHF